MKLVRIVTTLALLSVAGVAQAALTVQSNGTVFDDVLGVSWDQDANAVKTLCDAGDPIWTSFDPTSGRALADICALDGDLRWVEAVAWVAHLNSNAYKGFTNWRMPETTQPDSSCSSQTSDTPPQGFGFGCTGSELGHLFAVAAPAGLGNPSDACLPNCFQNTGPFSNTRQDIYRSGTDFGPDPGNAWEFNTRSGRQSTWPKAGNNPVTRFVWLVRPGPLAPVLPPIGPPQPAQPVPTLGALAGLLLIMLLAGMAWMRPETGLRKPPR